MEKTKKYKKPPLIEAVFELFFQSNNWSPATPGILYSRISKQYPIITQSGGGFGISLGNQGVQIGGGNNNLTQFKSTDNSSIIQLSNNLLTVNQLPKYDGWESYRKMIVDAISHLFDILEITTIVRVGLRTINKIDIKAHNYENFRNHFNVYPTLPESTDNNLNSIQISYETPFRENQVLAVNLGTLRKEPNYEAPVLFQLYFTKLTSIDRSSTEKWLDKAHDELHGAFDSILTSDSKKTFDNEQ
ncbi:MAG: TIGR04255 family protein [Cyclobacteriaceae bacterium]